jgi:hypothetical protein
MGILFAIREVLIERTILVGNDEDNEHFEQQ